MATIRDVAKQADVSVATVSNYLNATKPVSREASERIRQAIDELQYTASAAAKNLRRQKNHEIGVVLPNLDDPYYVQIFQGIEKVFSGSSYFLNPALSDDVPDLERQAIEGFLSKQICGLILVSCRPEDWKYYYDNFTSKGRPIVMIDRRVDALDANFVAVDSGTEIRQLTSALLLGGFRPVCLLSGPARFTCEESCIAGFRSAHTQASVPLSDGQMIQSPLTKESAFSKTISLLRTKKPGAIVTTSSLLAEGVIEGLHLLGYALDEIPVLTLGEEHWNKFTRTFASFSTSRPAIRAGDTAAQLLLGQLVSPIRDTEHIVLHDNTLQRSLLTSGIFAPAGQAARCAPGEKLRILMLDNPSVHLFEGLIRNFEQLTGVQTQIRFLPHHAIFDEIRTGADRYDITMFDIPWLPLLAQDVLADITDDLGSLDSSQFFPNCFQHFGAFCGKIYGIPFMYAPQMLYYRKDLFEDAVLGAEYERETNASLRPPLTMKEYNAVASFFTRSTDAVDYGVSVAAAYNECFAPEIYFRLQAFQSQIFGDDGTPAFDNPQTLKAYINFKHTIHLAKPNYLESTDVTIVDDFLRGDTAMLITYPAFLTNATDLRKSSASIGYSLVPGRRPLLGGWSFGISRQSSRREQALSFLHWTCDETISNYFTIMGGQTAISSTYTNDEMVKLYPWLPLYFKTYPNTQMQYQFTFRNGRPMPSKQIDDILCKWAYKCLIYNMEISDAIAETNRELTELLAPNSRPSAEK
jgi:multiple sugar transport system substrate-binding protein